MATLIHSRSLNSGCSSLVIFERARLVSFKRAATVDRMIDGGVGTDRAALQGADSTMMLSEHRLHDGEIIDLSGSGSNELQLNALDVLNRSSHSNSLRIDGEFDDVATSRDEGWFAARTTTIRSTTYEIYINGNATLLVDTYLIPNLS